MAVDMSSYESLKLLHYFVLLGSCGCNLCLPFKQMWETTNQKEFNKLNTREELLNQTKSSTNEC